MTKKKELKKTIAELAQEIMRLTRLYSYPTSTEMNLQATIRNKNAQMKKINDKNYELLEENRELKRKLYLKSKKRNG